MPIRAYLVLHRTLLLWCGAIALFVPFATILSMTSARGVDFGVFWNHFCGCAPAPRDVTNFLYASSSTALFIGLLLTFANRATATYIGAPTGSAFDNRMPYALTRPMRRSTALFAPVLIVFPAITTLPALGFAIIFGWMHLVHSPALAFFPQALRLIPDAAVLPPNASLFSLLVAAHAISIYLGSISIGFLAYVLFYSQRWLMLSRHPGVIFLAGFQITPIFILPLLSSTISPRVASWLDLLPKHQYLGWHLSALLLLLHYAIPAALMFWSWRVLQAADF